MKVSVIIPCTNRNEMLGMCLQALEKQNFPKEDYEVIVVGELSENFILKTNLAIKYVPYKLEEGARFPAALLRNIGAQDATGKVLVFLDCDMILMQEFLQNIWSQLSEESKLLFALRKRVQKGDKISCIQDLKHIKYEKDEREIVCSLFESDYTKIKSIWLWAYSHTMSLRKEEFFSAGMFSEQFEGWGLEDSEFAYRIYKRGIPIVCDSKSKCYHLWHAEKFDSSRAKSYEKNVELFRKIHKEPVLEGLNICERYFSPSMHLKLIKINMTIEVYCLSLFETYMRGFCDGSASCSTQDTFIVPSNK